MPRSPVESYLWRLIGRHSAMPDGTWTTYVADLPLEEAQRFAISLVFVDGARYDAGDTEDVFALQSISKPMTFAMALDRFGAEEVARHVDVEPSGVSFNALELESPTGLPPNPMVNSGAIAMAALMSSMDEILAGYELFAGRPLALDAELWAAELTVNHRNRAIANLLRGSGALDGEPERALELYLGQCSATVDCGDLAMIAATLANGGVNPSTGRRAASEETVRGVLSVMTSCGMYDGAGRWLFSVGMPAKSSVAGAIIAVLPGRFGLAVYSPPLDPNGNSIRGLAVCRDFSADMDLHMIESGRRPPSAVRARYTLAERTSKRQRGEDAQAVLAREGDRAVVFELQGELLFGEGEFVVREVLAFGADVVVLDFGRVRRVHRAVSGLLAGLVAELAEAGAAVLVSGVAAHPGVAAQLPGPTPAPTHSELDRAMEAAEELILAPHLTAREPAHVALADHELLSGLAPEAFAALCARLERRTYAAGQAVLRSGDWADEMLLVIAGELSVTIPTASAARPDLRVGTLSSGMLVGELSLLSGEGRSGDVVADTPVEAYALTREVLASLRATDPVAQAMVLENLARIAARRAQSIRDELALAVE